MSEPRSYHVLEPNILLFQCRVSALNSAPLRLLELLKRPKLVVKFSRWNSDDAFS